MSSQTGSPYALVARALAAVAGLFALFAAGLAHAKPETFTRFGGPAAGGYDVVAYFATGAPAKGDAAFAFQYQGAEWRFANAANLEAFKKDPAAYAPQYGGYCAWAVAQGYTAPGNPKNWSIVDGKLYLNYNDKVQRDWLVDPKGFIAKGDANWPGVLK